MPQSAASLVIARDGGTVEVENDHGDRVSLTISPFALRRDTKITMECVSSVPQQPFAATLFDGVKIGPSGLRFSESARLRFSSRAAGAGVIPITAMFIKSSGVGTVLPIQSEVIEPDQLVGAVGGLSTYFVANPTTTEFVAASQAATASAGSAVSQTTTFEEFVGDLEDFVAYIPSSSTPSVILDRFYANVPKLRRALMKRLISELEPFLQPPIPSDPCDSFFEWRWRLRKVIETIVRPAEQVYDLLLQMPLEEMALYLQPAKFSSLFDDAFGFTGSKQLWDSLLPVVENLNGIIEAIADQCPPAASWSAQCETQLATADRDRRITYKLDGQLNLLIDNRLTGALNGTRRIMMTDDQSQDDWCEPFDSGEQAASANIEGEMIEKNEFFFGIDPEDSASFYTTRPNCWRRTEDGTRSYTGEYAVMLPVGIPVGLWSLFPPYEGEHKMPDGNYWYYKKSEATLKLV